MAAKHGAALTLGNEPGVRTWLGEVESVPAFQGPLDAVFFNAAFGNVLDQREALLRSALLLRSGTRPSGWLALPWKTTVSGTRR